jgi:uncharacterized damage-inducible protein DinB
MTFGAPVAPGPAVDERELLLEYIRWQREQVVATAHDLTDEQLRWRPDGRLIPIGAIINHLTHMEWRWIEGRYAASEFPPRDDEFTLSGSVTGAQLVQAYWEQAQRTEAIVRAADDLDAPCLGDEGGRGPAHVLLGFDKPVTLRWTLLHVLEETAHHAGHADATRELLDGTRMRA